MQTALARGFKLMKVSAVSLPGRPAAPPRDAMPQIASSHAGARNRTLFGRLQPGGLWTAATVSDVAPFPSAKCDCSYSKGGCTITTPAPAGTACRCKYKGAWTCGGDVVSCKDGTSAVCKVLSSISFRSGRLPGEVLALRAWMPYSMRRRLGETRPHAFKVVATAPGTPT